MRSPSSFSTAFPQRNSRRWFILTAFVVVISLIVLGKVSGLITDYWWFSSIQHGDVFSTLFAVKFGLFATFGLVFFALMFGNLLLTNRLGARELTTDPADDIVRQFQNVVRPYAVRVYAVLSALTALIAGSVAEGQWNNYLLMSNSHAFHVADPLFHKDLSFYIFTLPFASFIVTWVLGALIATIIFVTVFHYLNGGIRAARIKPRVSASVKVHLSILLAVVAITKAAGYVVAKWELVNSTNGWVNGAGYTDVHARMPALSILFYMSLAAAAILLYNIRSRGWSLPVVAVALWAFVALVIGVAYPSILQVLKVNPAQSTLELPYIQRNIDATRAAYGITNVVQTPFPGQSSLSGPQLASAQSTLNNIRLWDPNPNIALETINRRQAIRSYYQFTSLGVDRYLLNGKETPVVVGAREINTANLTSPSWVNTHLEYTHGYGLVVSPANQVDSSTGNPTFAMSNVPPQSTNGAPALTQPGIYFGSGQNGWVVANTKQAELDYQTNSGAQAGTPVETHYTGTGGVPMNNIFRRAMYAFHLGDLNLLISNQITSHSRIMYIRDVTAIARKAAPFVTFDSQPYAVTQGGDVKFVVNGYTTTSQYPYSQNDGNQNVPADTNLPSGINYVRNSVVAVVDAYSGAITLYALNQTDPILQTYESAFPHLFTPMSAMPADIRSHLRYPADVFAMQSAVLGAYHITSPAAFYTASDQWTISPTTGAGSPSSTLSVTQVTDTQGNVLSQVNSPMDPLYQVMSLPGSSRQQLVTLTSYVPAGGTTTVQSLTGFLTATSDPDNYGQLTLYVTPRGASVLGPVQADSAIQQNAKVSSIITPLDQHGSNVLLGNNLMIPVGKAILYVRPLYVTSTSNPLPQLKYVICVFNQQVSIEPTLAGALSDALGSTVNTPTNGSGSGGSTGNHKTAAQYLAEASSDYALAQSSLTAGNLAAYQKYVNAMYAAIASAKSAL